MKQPDFDRAFGETPDCIRASVEIGFIRGRRAMKLRRKIAGGLSVAAALIITFAAADMAVSGLRTPKPDVFSPLCPGKGPNASGAPAVAARATPGDDAAPGGTATSAPEMAAVSPTASAAQATPTLEPTPPSELEAASTPEPSAASTAQVRPTPEPSVMIWDVNVGKDIAEADSKSAEIAVDFAYANQEHTYAEVVEAPEYEAASPFYATEAGRYYHLDPGCSGMTNAHELSEQEAIAAGKSACPVCVAAGVYYTPGGTYYHTVSDCSGMQNASAHSVSEAIEACKLHCPVCIGGDTGVYWLSMPESDGDLVYVSANNSYYHRNPECFRMAQPARVSLAEARAAGKFACPACLFDLSAGGPDIAEKCFATKNGKYYHEYEACSGMKGAVTMGVAEAQALGKLRCPKCSTAQPEHGELIRTAFGRGLNKLYEGFVYERSVISPDGSAEWYISCAGDESIQYQPDELPAVSYRPAGASTDACVLLQYNVTDILTDAPEPLKTICEVSLPEAIKQWAIGAHKDGSDVYYDHDPEIRSITVYFDGKGQVSGCNMCLDVFSGGVFWLGWKRDAQGEFQAFDYGENA